MLPAVKPFFQNDNMTLYCGDCRDILPFIPKTSVDLLLTDPPYGKVKDNDWDNLGQNELETLLNAVLGLSVPLLKPAAAVYAFSHPPFADRFATLIRRHFELKNHIVWLKRTPKGEKYGHVNKARISDFRNPFPETERILFAEMKNVERTFQEAKEHAFGGTMKPIIDYFRDARARSGLKGTEIQNKMWELTGIRYAFERHTFNLSQFVFPTRQTYTAAQSFLPLDMDYNTLENWYFELKKTFDFSYPRRYHAANKRTFTDVFEYMPITDTKKRFHPCHKPPAMIQDIITTSCPPGGMVLDCFAGSGQTGISALATGRRAILIERETAYCQTIVERIRNAETQPALQL